MEFFFYSSSLITIVFTIFSIFSRNLMYSLLHLIVSFLFTSCIFFSLGAVFAGALEVIIYAGAIMVLFIFVLMTFDFKKSDVNWKKTLYEKIIDYIKFVSLILVLVYSMFFILSYAYDKKIFYTIINTKLIAVKLFGDYVLIIELSALVLLSALVIVFHIGRTKN